jgi:hypothetical protein
MRRLNTPCCCEGEARPLNRCVPPPAPRAPAARKRLGARPGENALLLAEPTHATRASRERAVEALFEGQGPPALHLARGAVLGALAVGKQSALVIDAGHRGTTGGRARGGGGWGRAGDGRLGPASLGEPAGRGRGERGRACCPARTVLPAFVDSGEPMARPWFQIQLGSFTGSFAAAGGVRARVAGREGVKGVRRARATRRRAALLPPPPARGPPGPGARPTNSELRTSGARGLPPPPRSRHSEGLGQDQINSFSMASFRLLIWVLSWLPSLVVTDAAMTGRDTPQARPSAALEGTNT